MTLQRRQLRGPNLPRQNQRPNQRQNLQTAWAAGPQQPNSNPQQKGNPTAPRRGGGLQERLKKLNPFAPKRPDQLPR